MRAKGKATKGKAAGGRHKDTLARAKQPPNRPAKGLEDVPEGIEPPEWCEPFLDRLSESGIVIEAVDAIDVSRSTVYRYRKAEEWFALAWKDCQEEGADRLESTAWRLANGIEVPVFFEGRQVGTRTEYSERLLIVLLKAAKPEKFRERSATVHEFTGPMPPLHVSVESAEEYKERRASYPSAKQREPIAEIPEETPQLRIRMKAE